MVFGVGSEDGLQTGGKALGEFGNEEDCEVRISGLDGERAGECEKSCCNPDAEKNEYSDGEETWL